MSSSNRPLLSVIIPTYNRPQHLPPLFDSILSQSFTDYEVVVLEDCAPRREEVRAICDEYAVKSGGKLRCHYNEHTLGYDGNFRKLVELAKGRYLFVMGDDDLVRPGAFAAVAGAIERHPNLGLLLRAFAFFDDDPEKPTQITRYYAQECSFPAGRKAILAGYRRMVVMSGLVMDRDVALKHATTEWDGSLFYQHWLAGNILAEKDAVYIPDVLVHFRRASPRSFGTAKVEAALYTPGKNPTDTSLKGVKFQLEIADAIEKRRGIRFTDDLRRDFANYVFPTFYTQSAAPWPDRYRLYKNLGALGLAKHPMFHIWFWTATTFGAGNVDRVLQLVRRVVGHTPNISRFVLPESKSAERQAS